MLPALHRNSMWRLRRSWQACPNSGSGGAHLAEETPHLLIELLGVARELLGEVFDLVCGRARVAARACDAGHRLGARARLARRAIDALRDGGNCGVLLLDRGGDPGGDRGHLRDDRIDLL